MITNRMRQASAGLSELPAASHIDTVRGMPLERRQSRCPRFSLRGLRLPAILIATVVLSILIVRHTPGIDGPWYAHYGFHRAPALRIYPLMALCGLPLLAGLLLFERRPARPALPLALVMLSVIGFTLTAVAHRGNEPSSRPMIESIRSPMAMSYFADASALMMGPGNVRDWLASWPQLLPEMFLHTQTKPPGAVLYFAGFIHYFGVTEHAAFISGLFTACIIALAIPLTYWLARVWGAQGRAAFCAAACLALFPSIILFFPSLDAAYVTASCALLGLWTIAVRRNSPRAAIAFGIVLALITFFIYNVLVIGVLLAGVGWIAAPRERRVTILIRQGAVALVTCIALYVALWVVTGFDPIASFRAASRNQSRLLAGFDRPYPATVLFDLLDFALGVGWLSLLLALFYLFDRAGPAAGPPRALVVAGLLQLLVVAATGLLPGETARVWAFCTPVIALPAGAELARWSRGQRLAAYGCMFMILTLLAQNLHEIHGRTPPLVGQSRPSAQ